jgi:hypothetical protein
MAGDLKNFYQRTAFKTATLLFLVLSLCACSLFAPRRPAADYSRLVEFMQLEDRSTPVYAFNDFVKRFDSEFRVPSEFQVLSATFLRKWDLKHLFAVREKAKTISSKCRVIDIRTAGITFR